jgi:hypothetical protein
MKTILSTISRLLFLVLILCICIPYLVFAQNKEEKGTKQDSLMTNEPKGFRNYKWFLERDKIPGLKENADGWYVKKGEDLFYEGFKAKEIKYLFTDNLLEHVNIIYDTCNIPIRIYPVLSEKLARKYGNGKIDERSNFWRGKSACVKLEDIYNGDNCSYVDLNIYNPTIFIRKNDVLDSGALKYYSLKTTIGKDSAIILAMKWIRKQKDVANVSYNKKRKIIWVSYKDHSCAPIQIDPPSPFWEGRK